MAVSSEVGEIELEKGRGDSDSLVLGPGYRHFGTSGLVTLSKRSPNCLVTLQMYSFGSEGSMNFN